MSDNITIIECTEFKDGMCSIMCPRLKRKILHEEVEPNADLMVCCINCSQLEADCNCGTIRSCIRNGVKFFVTHSNS